MAQVNLYTMLTSDPLNLCLIAHRSYVALFFMRRVITRIKNGVATIFAASYPAERSPANFLATRITVRSETFVSLAVSLILSLLITRS